MSVSYLGSEPSTQEVGASPNCRVNSLAPVSVRNRDRPASGCRTQPRSITVVEFLTYVQTSEPNVPRM